MSPETPDTPSPPLPHDARRVEFRSIRAELRLTQKAYGAALGCNANTVARYERGVIRLPLPILALARALRGRPRQVLTVTRKARVPQSRLTSAAFVLVRVLADETRCWHAPASVEEVLAANAAPCQGKRLHFVALLPPTKRVEKRRTETITCEEHAYTALYWLQKQYQGWMTNVISRSGRRWFQQWRETLRRMHEDAKAQAKPPVVGKRGRGRPRTQEKTPICP